MADEYIQALIDTRENEDIEIFLNCMTELHCTHLKHDIEQFIKSVEADNVVDKEALIKEMVDKAVSRRENGRYFAFYDR